MAELKKRWLDLQLFADGGDGGGDGASAATGETAPDAGETRLRELGVPEAVLDKRAKRTKKSTPAADAQQRQETAPAVTTPETQGDEQTNDTARMSWDEIMADPEYNKRMQETIQARLKNAKGAEENMQKLAPAIELLARRYGLDADNLDTDALADAISNDDTYYEDRALEMGVPVEMAKKIDQTERENARMRAEQERTIEEQKIRNHIAKLQEQGEAMKQVFPGFDLATELQNPAFARMTSPNVGISVEDAYYAIHRKEIQVASMQATAQHTAQQIANSIRSGKQRPVEHGTSAQAPSKTTFNYAAASKEQREALKKRIREAAAKGQKLYPGQF